MILLFLIPGLTAITNRLWRGEGQIPRWLWYLAMTALGFVATISWQFTAAWLLFLLGYALAPWQAMFATVTGRAPGRKDSWAWQWMQTLTYKIYPNPLTAYDWVSFGAIYGTIRAGLMIPGIIAITYVVGPVGLTGLVMLSLGLIYRWSAKVRDHFQLREDMAIPIAEVTTGWLIGTYLLIIAVNMLT